MEQANAIELKNITKRFGEVVANDSVDLSVKHGEILSVLGENGSGKTTLMNMISGIYFPDEGQIFVDGEEVSICSPKDSFALGIGMIHQHFKLVDVLTAAENIILGLEGKSVLDMKKVVQDIQEVTERYGFELDPNQKIYDMSVSQKQTVEIVKMLYRGANILILDEPTAVLTPQETEKLFEQLKLLRDNGHVLVFISHKIREVVEICDRVTIMRAGRSVGVYNVHGDEILGTKDITEDEISRLMVGRDAVLEIDKQEVEPGKVVLHAEKVFNVDDEGKVRVNNVSFSVRQGEILGVAGVEGNGQTELIAMLTGMMPMDAGDVKINKKSIKGKSLREIRSDMLAYIPQDRLTYGVTAGMDIMNNVIPFLMNDRKYVDKGVLKVKKLRGLADEAAKDFMVKCDSSDQIVSMLSGGNMQKVVVGRELSSKTRHPVPLVVADQPSRGIDIGATKFIHRKLLEMRSAGTAILLISADLNEILELSDSVIVLYDGQIVGYFPDTRELAEQELGQYMLGIKVQSPEEVKGVCHGE